MKMMRLDHGRELTSKKYEVFLQISWHEALVNNVLSSHLRGRTKPYLTWFETLKIKYMIKKMKSYFY